MHHGTQSAHLRLLVTASILTVASISLCSQTAASGAASAAPAKFRAGGLSIAIPSPSGDLVETDSDYRVILEPVAPVSNRLVAAFVTPDALKVIRTGTQPPMTEYAVVEVGRRLEFTDVDAAAFGQVVGAVGQQFSEDLGPTLKEQQDEANRRIKTLSGKDTTVTLDKPVQLGSFFSKPDEAGFGMIMPISVNGITTRGIVATTVIRVRKRLFFAYIYDVFKDENSVTSIKATAEQWADAILKANP